MPMPSTILSSLREPSRLRVFRLSALAFAAASGVSLGACFVGESAAGLPCTADVQCGVELSCIDGLCGGEFACGDEMLPAEDICNGVIDCPDGSDEDWDLCDGEGEFFLCDEDLALPISFLCNGVEDCEDGSDELECDEEDTETGTAEGTTEEETAEETTETSEEGPNLCEGTPGTEFEYFDGPTQTGLDNPLGVIVGQFVGDNATDAIVGSKGGVVVRLYQFTMGGLNMTEFVGEEGAALAFGDRNVVDVKTADLDLNGTEDVIIAAYGSSETDGVGVYSFQAVDDDAPQLYGANFYDPTPLGELQAIEVGDLSGDNRPDLVTVRPDGTETMTVVAYIGNPNNPPLSLGYFETVTGVSTSVELSEFHDTALIDANDDGVLELLISGLAGSDAVLYHLSPDFEGVPAWTLIDSYPMMVPAQSIAVGNIDDDPFEDFAVLSFGGVIQTWGNMMGNGFMMGPEMLVGGGETSGLNLHDVNCDGNTDFAYVARNPSQVRVVFGDGVGSGDIDEPLVLGSSGEPQGQVGVASFDMDSTPDLFYATDNSPELRIWTSTDIPMMP